MASPKRNKSTHGVRKITLKNGETRYEARINVMGHKNVSKTFRSKTDAVAWRSRSLTQALTGAPAPKKGKYLVADAIDAHTAHLTTTHAVTSNHLTEFMKVKDDLGDRPVQHLTAPEIETWLSMLQTCPRGHFKDGREKPPYAEASARKFFYCLKTALDWHSRHHRYSLAPYLFALNKAAKPRAWAGQRLRRLLPGEEQRLYAGGLTRKGCYTSQDWEALIGFAIETAMREQEIFRATFQDVDATGELLSIHLSNSKTEQSRVVPLSDKAKAIIELQRQSSPTGSKRIFHQFPSAAAICARFADLAKRVKIDDLHFHDLRHEAISRLCVSHVMTMQQIMDMSGHSSFATFRGYVQLYAMHERNALQKAVQQSTSDTGPFATA